MLLTLAQSTIWVTLASTALVVVSLFLILCVIVQKPKGGGLAGAFSGGGGAQADSAFGASASNVAVTLTISAFIAFLLLTISLALMLGGSEPADPDTALETMPITAEDTTETTNDVDPDSPAMDFDLPDTNAADDESLMDLPAGTLAPTLTPSTTNAPAATPAPMTTNTPSDDEPTDIGTDADADQALPVTGTDNGE